MSIQGRHGSPGFIIMSGITDDNAETYFEDKNMLGSQMVAFGMVPPTSDGEFRARAVLREEFDAYMTDQFWESTLLLADNVWRDEPPYVVFYYPDDLNARSRDIVKRFIFDNRYDVNIALAHIRLAVRIPTLSTYPYERWVSDYLDRLQPLLSIPYASKWLDVMVKAPLHGIKTIPLTIAEMKHPEDIRYRVWREYLINRLIVAASQVGGFQPFIRISQWMLFHDIDEEFFINPHMIARLIRGRETHAVMSMLENMSSAAKDVNTVEVDKAVKQSETVKMSRNAISYVVYTPGIDLANKRKSYTVHQWNVIAYGLLRWLAALHEGLGVIHADLHMGNVACAEAKKPQTSTYKIGAKYYTASSTVWPYIFDYSRSIINPYGVMKTYTRTNLDVVAIEQAALLEQLFASVMRNADEYMPLVKSLAKKDFATLFGIMTLLDPISLCSHIIEYCATVVVEYKEDIAAIFVNIKTKCEKMLIGMLTEVSAAATPLHNNPGTICPLRAIIEDVFAPLFASDEKPTGDHWSGALEFLPPPDSINALLLTDEEYEHMSCIKLN